MVDALATFWDKDPDETRVIADAMVWKANYRKDVLAYTALTLNATTMIIAQRHVEGKKKIWNFFEVPVVR
jgi:hypothetical protein